MKDIKQKCKIILLNLINVSSARESQPKNKILKMIYLLILTSFDY